MKGMLAACDWKAFKTCCASTCTCQTGEKDNASGLCSADSILLMMKGAGGESTARLNGGVLKWCTLCSAANSQRRGCLEGADHPCEPPWQVKTITYVWGALCLAYLVLYIAYNCTANHRFSKLPYGRYRTGHALYAWQVRIRSFEAQCSFSDMFAHMRHEGLACFAELSPLRHASASLHCMMQARWRGLLRVLEDASADMQCASIKSPV